jgi:hypothetical protein
MTRKRARFVSYAWAALAAVVFSALSPALAAAMLHDRPAALGQMLGIPEPAPEPQTSHDVVEHAAHHGHAMHDGAATPPEHDGSARHAHGIYCSFCLNASSTAAVLAVPVLPVFAKLGSIAIAAEPLALATAPSYPWFRSRAPPL